MTKQHKILTVVIEHRADEDGDASHIGSYSDKRDDWNIERSTGEYVCQLPEDFEFPERSREYKFFTPYAGGEKPGTADYQTYGKQDFARIESLQRGDWGFIGIVAKAVIASNGGLTQTLRSGGLYGIESDSDTEHFAEVEREELAALRTELESFGFSKRAIQTAFAKVERKG